MKKGVVGHVVVICVVCPCLKRACTVAQLAFKAASPLVFAAAHHSLHIGAVYAGIPYILSPYKLLFVFRMFYTLV